MVGKTQDARWQEIKTCQEVLKPHVDTLKRDEAKICGLYYGDGMVDGKEVPDDPENHAQVWLRMFHAENTLSTPEYIIEPAGQEWPDERAYLVEAGVNRMVHQSGLKATLHRCASDYANREVTAVCFVNPMPGWEGENDPPWICGAKRIPFDEYARDMSVVDRADGAWEAHRVSRPIEDVIREAEQRPELGWNMSVLRQLEKQIEADAKIREQINKSSERRDLIWWPMWERLLQQPGKTARAGYNGSVHYVLDGSMPTKDIGEDVRKSEAWFGHRTGPYAHDGALYIGNQRVALSPLVATGVQADWVNVVAKAMMMAMANFKSLIATTDADMKVQIESALNGSTVHTGAMDLRMAIATIEAGGLSEQFLIAFQQALESLQRNAGTYQNREGQVQADATATAILDAQQGFNATMAFWSDGWRSFQQQIGVKFAFWTDLHPKVRLRVGPLPEDVQEKLGLDQPFTEIKGGFGADEKQWSALDHELMDMRVSTFSGRPRNEQTLMTDAMGLVQWMQGLANLGPMARAVEKRKYMRIYARARGMRDAERLLDSELFDAVLDITLQSQNPPPNVTTQRPTLTIGGGNSGARATPMPNAQPVKKQLGPMAAPKTPKSGGAAKKNGAMKVGAR